MIKKSSSPIQLLELLKATLTFSASVNKHALLAKASSKNCVIRNKQKLRIESVLDSGDFRGIVCTGNLGADKGVVAIALTHFRFDLAHRLYKQVRAYQIHRTKALAPRRVTGDSGR